MAKGTPWAKGRRRLKAAKGQGRHGRQGPPRDEGRHRPRLIKGVGHEERMAISQRERVAMGAKGLRAAKNALGPRALISSHSQKCQHNLAHNLSHNPAHNPVHNPAHEPAHNPVRDPVRDPAHDPAKGG